MFRMKVVASRRIVANGVSDGIPEKLDMMLQDFAQATEKLDYNDIVEFGNVATTKDIKALRSAFKTLNAICDEMMMDYYEAAEEDDEATEYVNKIVRIVKGN